MNKSTTVTLFLTPQIVERPDRWAVICKEMGIIVYAQSREDVKKNY